MMAYSSIRPFASDGENWRQTTMTTIDRYDFSNLNDIKKEDELLMMPIEGIMRGELDGKNDDAETNQAPVDEHIPIDDEATVENF